MKIQDEFNFKITEFDQTVTLTYDRWGGMKVTKKQPKENGANLYQELYLSREAMFELACTLLKNKSCKNASTNL